MNDDHGSRCRFQSGAGPNRSYICVQLSAGRCVRVAGWFSGEPRPTKWRPPPPSRSACRDALSSLVTCHASLPHHLAPTRRRLEKFLGLWLWHPLAHLSYAGYMLTPICAEMSFRALGGVAAVVPGYGYFSKIYFATLGQ